MFYLFGVICWTCFWLTFGPHVGPCCGPCRDQIGPRMGQDGSKRAIKSFRDPKPIKTCISKNLANIRFCYVFGGQGRPRQPQKAKEGSPEAPEDLQNRKQKGSKHGPKNDNMFEKVWGNLGEYFGDRICSREPKMGLVLEPSGRLIQASALWRPSLSTPGVLHTLDICRLITTYGIVDRDFAIGCITTAAPGATAIKLR